VRRAALAACLLALGWCGPAVAAQDAPGDALARVNGHTITMVELERQLLVGAGARQGQGSDTSQAGRSDVEMRRLALRQLVEHYLLLDEARSKYLGGESVKKVLDQFAADRLREFERKVGSPLEARRALRGMGMSVEEFKRYQTEALLVGKLLWEEVDSQVHVSPAQMRRYYREHLDEFKEPRTIIYRQILFPLAEGTDEAATRRLAQQVLGRLRAGEDFAALADEYSADREDHPGGLHRVRVPSDLGDWLPPAVRGLEPGRLSGIRQGPGGLSIVLLERIVPPRQVPFEEAQAAIEAKLTAAARADAKRRFIQRLERQGRVEYLPAARRLDLIPASP